MQIVNYGYMGMIINMAPNYGTQIGAVAPAGSNATGLVVNYSLNAGTQIGILLS